MFSTLHAMSKSWRLVVPLSCSTTGYAVRSFSATFALLARGCVSCISAMTGARCVYCTVTPGSGMKLFLDARTGERVRLQLYTRFGCGHDWLIELQHAVFVARLLPFETHGRLCHRQHPVRERNRFDRPCGARDAQCSDGFIDGSADIRAIGHSAQV